MSKYIRISPLHRPTVQMSAAEIDELLLRASRKESGVRARTELPTVRRIKFAEALAVAMEEFEE